MPAQAILSSGLPIGGDRYDTGTLCPLDEELGVQPVRPVAVPAVKRFALLVFIALAMWGCCPAARPVHVGSPTASQPDPMTELSRAERAFEARADREALSRALWCLDHGYEKDHGFLGVLGTTVPHLLAALALRYPPAKTLCANVA